MSADDNDMWLAVAARLLPNLDILTAHPTRQSLASLIGLSIHEAGLRLVGLREDTDDDDGHGHGGTVEPDHGRGHEHDAGRTDRGVYGSGQRPEHSQTGNPYLYVMPLPGMVVIDRQRRRVSARVEYVSKSKLRSRNEASDR